jgi:hypothetical protein
VYSINPVTKKVMHKPFYYEAPHRALTAANEKQYVGATARIMCSVTAKITAPGL